MTTSAPVLHPPEACCALALDGFTKGYSVQENSQFGERMVGGMCTSLSSCILDCRRTL